MSAGTMIGSDPDSLDQAAKQFDDAARLLDDSAKALANMLGSMSWLGQIAVNFFDAWHGHHGKRINNTAGFLRDAAAELRAHATEQREASRGDDVAWLKNGRKISDAVAIAELLLPDLIRLIKASPAEQLAWWNSLSDAQRAALLSAKPGDLIALHGLPADVIDKAYENYYTSIGKDLLTSSSSVKAEIEVKVAGAEFGAGIEVTVEHFRDGSVKVDVSESVAGGVSAEELKVLRSMGLGGKFEFASQAEADAWIERLGRAAAHGDLVGFLKESASHLGSVRIENGGEVSVGVGAGVAAAGIALAGNVVQSIDTLGEGKGNVTLSAEAEFSAHAEGGVFGVSGKMSVESSITLDGTTPKSISFEVSFESAGAKGLFSELATISEGRTMSGTAEITLDLTRPELQSVAPELMAAMARGDVAAAAHIVENVLDQAQVVVQTTTGTESTRHFGASFAGTGVEAEYSTSTSQATSTFVRPPHGEFREVK